MEKNRVCIVIDLKSFYASVECQQRGLDPMTENLVVADQNRTEKTICLAVSPALKQHGISGRARLFEVVQQIKQANLLRQRNAPGNTFTGTSCNDAELKTHPEPFIDYIVAPPRMALYMQISSEIYGVYLRHVAPEDIHVYSIDEVLIDATAYLNTYRLTPREFAMKIMLDVLNTTGITATAGIGSNLYLAKVAMDILAKKMKADSNGVRIAELDEKSYRHLLWSHQPITDFWRVGSGYARKLARYGIFTMGDVARCSLENEKLLYNLFGINAELLIDHAWGWEPCTVADIKAYKPASNSIGVGQVLQCPYTTEKARLVVREMTDQLVLDLVDKGLVTDQIVLTIGYDIENLSNSNSSSIFTGEVVTNRYGRNIPKHSHGTGNLGKYTSSMKAILQAVTELYDRIVNNTLLIRRLNVTANHIIGEREVPDKLELEQLNLFVDYEEEFRQKMEEAAALEREKRKQQTVLAIKKKFGKNAILKGMNLEDGATAKDRNAKIGGHKA